MLALAGVIQGNTVVVENDSITNYDGREVIIIPYLNQMCRMGYLQETFCST